MTRSDQWSTGTRTRSARCTPSRRSRSAPTTRARARNGAFHPVSWCRDYDGGRSFYTGMGHTEGSYGEDDVPQPPAGALQWTTGIVRGDCQATIASNYRIERLTAANQPGAARPDRRAARPDRRARRHASSTSARRPARPGRSSTGTTRTSASAAAPSTQYDPKTKQVKLLTTLAGDGQPGQRRRAGEERGGPARHRARPELRRRTAGSTSTGCRTSRSTADQRIGQRTVSRFTYDRGEPDDRPGHPQGPAARGTTQIHSCCHAGGGMTFDEQRQPVHRLRRQQLLRRLQRLLRQQLDPGLQGRLVPGRPPHRRQHQRPERQDPPDPPGARRHVHDPGRQPVHRHGAGRRQDPPGDLRDGRTQHRPARHATRSTTGSPPAGSARTPAARARTWARPSTRPPRSSPRRATRAGRTAWATGSPTGTAATPTPRVLTGWYDCDNLKNDLAAQHRSGRPPAGRGTT